MGEILKIHKFWKHEVTLAVGFAVPPKRLHDEAVQTLLGEIEAAIEEMIRDRGLALRMQNLGIDYTGVIYDD